MSIIPEKNEHFMQKLSNLIKIFKKNSIKKLNVITQFMYNLFNFLVFFDDSNNCFYQLARINQLKSIFFCFSALRPILLLDHSAYCSASSLSIRKCYDT